MKEKWLEIIDIDRLVNFSRQIVYSNFDEKRTPLNNDEFLESIKNLSEAEEEEMNRVLPFLESKNIMRPYIKKKKNKKTNKTTFIMKESDYDQVLVEYNQRMVSNIVSGLVSKGVLDMAFDNEKNDFVFWVKKDI